MWLTQSPAPPLGAEAMEHVTPAHEGKGDETLNRTAICCVNPFYLCEPVIGWSLWPLTTW